jgi:general secretion pathway protein B
MSYILDALKKLERERNLGAVPNIDTLHLPAHMPDARRSPWGWILGISIALVAGLTVLLWRFMPGGPETTAESATSPATVEEPPAQAPAKPKNANPAQAIAKTETKPPPAKPSPAKRPPAPPAEPAKPVSPPPEPIAEEATAEIEETPPAKVPAPAEPPAPKFRGNRASAEAAVRPTAPTPERVEHLRAAMERRQLELARRPLSASSPPERAIPDQALAAPREPLPPPPAPKKTKPPEPPTRDALKNYREVAASLGVPNLRLNMLAYSDDSGERIVNINSQTYHEGETVDGKIKIEGIVRDGAILSYGGQRFLLKP